MSKKTLFIIYGILLIVVLGFGQEPRLVLPESHIENIKKVTFSSTSDLLLSQSTDKCLIWNIKYGKVIMTIQDASSKIINASFNSNGTKVLATINNKGAYIYNLNTAKVDASFYVNNAICLDAIYSKDEQTIITTFSDSTIYFYNIKFNKVESSIKLPFVCNEIMLNASGSKLYCATDSIYTDYNIGENIVEKLTKCIELKTQKIDGSRYLRDSLLKLSSSEFANSFLFSKKILRSSKKQDLNYDLYKDSCFVLDKLSKKILLRFTDRYNAAHLFSYAKKNSLIAITSNNIISIFNTKKWTLLNKLRGYNTKVNAVTYNAKLNLLLSIHNNKIVKQWDLSNAKLSFSLKDPSLCSELSSSYYCNKNSIVLIEPCDKTITGVWDANTGKEITIDSASHSIYSDCANKYDSISSDYILNAISPNNIELISDNIDSINLLNKDNMTLIKTLYRRNDLGALLGNRLIKKVSFNKTGSYFMIYKINNEIDVWDDKKLEIHFTMKGESGLLINDTILSVVDNDAIVFYDIKNKIEKYRLIAFNSYYDYIIMLPNKYYCSEKSATKLLYYVDKDLKIITFQQLDVKYNRPDKVLEAMGITDTILIKSYHKAWEKRVKKLGIDTTAFKEGYSVPELEIKNNESILYEQTQKQITLNIKALDSIYNLNNFNVWINEIPLFGMRGISLKTKKINQFDTAIIVNLSQGENKIEASVVNTNGTESFRFPINVKYNIKPNESNKPKIYFIGIGANHFKDSKYNLTYCRKDIQNLATAFKTKYNNAITIDTLMDEQVTITNIKALKQKLLQTNINDKVIISYSGHGLFNKNYDYYLATHNINFEEPEKNGLPYEGLESLLDSIPARQKLLLLDACHSGEIDKEELQKLQAIATSMDSTSNKSINAKRIKLFVDSSHKTVGIKNSFELMQNLFVNVGKGTGATIISAAAGTQFAQERGDLKNGVFTYSILELFEKNKTITVSELKKYVNQRVAEITKGAQQPTSRTETLQNDWMVW